MKTILIWLDDIRDPKEYLFPRVYMSCEVIWVGTYEQFIRAYDEYHEMDLMISLDHDLGEEKSGYDCLKYIAERCMENDTDLPYIEIHSANPVGRRNMEDYIKSYNKIRNYGKGS